MSESFYCKSEMPECDRLRQALRAAQTENERLCAQLAAAMARAEAAESTVERLSDDSLMVLEQEVATAEMQRDAARRDLRELAEAAQGVEVLQTALDNEERDVMTDEMEEAWGRLRAALARVEEVGNG